MLKIKNLFKILLMSTFMFAASIQCLSAAPKTEYKDGERVYDFANLFSLSEEDMLREYALSMEDEAECEFYVLTTDDAAGKSAMAYADDFGDNGAFGYEKPYGTYIVFLIDMDNREIWLSTSGDALDKFSNERIDYLLDAAFEYVADGYYYDAADVYIEIAGKYMISENLDEVYVEEVDAFSVVLLCFFGSAVVSGIVLLIMASGAKTQMSTGSGTYMQGGVNINRRDDIFTHTTTVKRRIETNTGSSGGGGRHVSSGGRSHGGGGRKF